MHLRTAVNAFSFTRASSHHDEKEISKPVQPYKTATVSTEEEFDQILNDHHHRRVIVFCLATPHNEFDEVMERWCHHYERLNGCTFCEGGFGC